MAVTRAVAVVTNGRGYSGPTRGMLVRVAYRCELDNHHGSGVSARTIHYWYTDKHGFLPEARRICCSRVGGAVSIFYVSWCIFISVGIKHPPILENSIGIRAIAPGGDVYNVHGSLAEWVVNK